MSSGNTPAAASAPALSRTAWLICIIAAIGFAFDIYELLMLPLIIKPAMAALSAPLVEALHARGFEIAIETNGTQVPPPGIDWICVSPKADAPLVLSTGNELKLVYPQPKAMPERFEALEFQHFFLQPMDGPNQAENIQAAIAYCLAHPKWRLSLQTHKLTGMP